MTARKDRRYVETEEYLKFIRRIMGSLGSRVGDADIEMLREMAKLGDLVEELVGDTVIRLREQHGYSWADIGRSLGITRQSAHERFRRQGVPDKPVSDGLDRRSR